MVGIQATLITFGVELAFHPQGLCVSGSAHVTFGGKGGMMSTAGLKLPFPRMSQAKFGSKLLRGESNVMFMNAN